MKSVITILGVFITTSLIAADWPQYRGPNDDGSSSEKILKDWPKTGLPQIWKAPTTDGFSSFTASGGKVFTQISRDEEGIKREACIALDAKTGKEVWSKILGVSKYGHDGGNAGASDNKGGDGPRSTPSVDDGKVYVLSSDLVLSCLDAKDGKTIWEKDLVKEHGARNISWKNAASPLIEGDLVYVCAGGEGQSLLGIDKQTGRVIWKTQSDMMTHASPVTATILDTKQIIFFTQTGLVSVEPKTGGVLWRYKFPFTTSSAASPVVGGDIVFCSAGYGVGAGAVKISKKGKEFVATELWRQPNQLQIHWSTPVYKDGYLYGMFSFREFAKGPLKCVEIATGKEVWSQPGFGPGNCILADGHIIALSDKGEVVLIEATPKEYREKSRTDVLDGKCWSTPSLSDGHLFARSTKEGVCLDISSK